MRRLLFVILAAITALAMSAPAFAASITINKAPENAKYTAYKILNKDDTGYYLTETEYNGGVGAVLKSSAVGMTFTKISDRYYLDNAASFADGADLAKKLNGKKTDINAVGGHIDKKGPSSPAENETSVTFDNLSAGYWFVTTDTGSLCILRSGDQDYSLDDKNAPGLDKTVKGGDKSSFVGTGKEDGSTADNTADVGDILTYKVVITAKNGATMLKFNDTLSTGLKYQTGSLKIYKEYTDETTNTPLESSNYDTPVTTDNSIEVNFKDTYLDSLTGDTTITLVYKAEITAAAKTEDKVNNTATLTYGTNHTITDKTRTDLFGFKVTKVDAADTTTLLGGAQFTLSRNGSSGTEYLHTDGTWGDNTNNVFTTPDEGTEKGILKFNGLEAGTYTLTETAAPTDYTITKATTTIIISADGKITIDGKKQVDANGDDIVYTNTNVPNITIKNVKPGDLPNSGGSGTMMFYIIGAIIVAGAATTIIIRRRRMNAE